MSFELSNTPSKGKLTLFSQCLILTTSIIIKGYLCGENALKVMIPYVL